MSWNKKIVVVILIFASQLNLSAVRARIVKNYKCDIAGCLLKFKRKAALENHCTLQHAQSSVGKKSLKKNIVKNLVPSTAKIFSSIMETPKKRLINDFVKKMLPDIKPQKLNMSNVGTRGNGASRKMFMEGPVHYPNSTTNTTISPIIFTEQNDELVVEGGAPEKLFENYEWVDFDYVRRDSSSSPFDALENLTSMSYSATESESEKYDRNYKVYLQALTAIQQELMALEKQGRESVIVRARIQHYEKKRKELNGEWNDYLELTTVW